MGKIEKNRGALVYSTEGGRMCPACRRSVGQCACGGNRQPAPPADGIVRVARESKGRNGKSVTLVKGLTLDPDALIVLGKQLKTACGSGGTVKDGVIEIQGDHRERIVELLGKQGWTLKRAGG